MFLNVGLYILDLPARTRKNHHRFLQPGDPPHARGLDRGYLLGHRINNIKDLIQECARDMLVFMFWHSNKFK